MREVWSGEDAASLSDSELVAVNERYCRMRRMLDADQAQLAAEIARRSRPELGPESLAKTQGFRNPTALIAATAGTSNGDAARLVKVGEATAPRQLLSGEKAPARHPHIAIALDRAGLTAQAAAAIITMLDRVALRAGIEAIDAAEKILAEQAPGLSMDQLSRLLVRAEAWLDPDGVAPREDEARTDISLTIREERGRIVMVAEFDPASGAPVKTAIEGWVSAEMRATRDADRSGASDPDAPRRSVKQMQAEALVRLCEHALGCERTDLPLEGATVVVRIDHEDLVNGTGYATIDGITAPVSVAPPGGWPPAARSSRACSVATARSSTGAARGGSSPGLSASPSSNATADARCAGHHPGRSRSITSGGGRGMPAPPTSRTACSSARAVITASTTTGGRSASREPGCAARSGSSRHPTSTPPARLASGAEPGTTSRPEPPYREKVP